MLATNSFSLHLDQGSGITKNKRFKKRKNKQKNKRENR